MSMSDTIASLAYKTPDGFVDIPYFYMYDAKSLANGSNQQNLVVNIDQDTDFVMRRVVGMNLCVNANATGMFQVRDKSQLQFFQTPIRPGLVYPSTVAISGSWPVMPEKIYPAGSQIGFDLYGVLRHINVATPTIFRSQLGFHGVRRFRQGAIWVHNTDYAYHELPYTYQYPLTIDWGHWTDGTNGIVNNTRSFGVQILETDFELCAIGVTYADGTQVNGTDFQMSLYDPSGSVRLSNLPVNVNYWNLNPVDNVYGSPVFPVPSIVWPTKGFINFELTSMLPFGTAKSYMFHFMGIWRAKN